MNREETKKAIEVMQAYVDGKVVEYFAFDAWFPVNQPGWSFNDTKYRIKPEPREYWVNVYPGGIYVYKSKEDADLYCSVNRSECIRVREIL